MLYIKRYYRINISETEKTISHTEIKKTGINFFKLFIEKKSKKNPNSYYSSEIIHHNKTHVFIYKAGELSSIHINGWTFPSNYCVERKYYRDDFPDRSMGYSTWSDAFLKFNCENSSGKTIHIVTNGENVMDSIIQTISYLIKPEGDVPSGLYTEDFDSYFAKVSLGIYR